MLDTHHDFWNQWSQAYRGFSETVEPYRAAQRQLAEGAVAALNENLARKNLSILDVGGGAGNLIRPLLEELARRREHLDGVSYTLTDGAKEMTELALQRLEDLKQRFPKVKFSVLHLDTLAEDFHDNLGSGIADLVICSWNIEYYPTESRRKIIQRLVRLAHPRGVVAFSSSVQLPDDLNIRDVLMPLGQAQVLQALLTGGLGEMKKVISNLKQIAAFGTAMSSRQFPEKPGMMELAELATQTGLESVVTGYHLFGASVMVVARKDEQLPPPLPQSPIAQALVGKPGYEAYPDTATFFSYFGILMQMKKPVSSSIR
ncbi:MAG: class I SAM-dependent methyltransferase [Methylococcaceae bacterium]|jgi:ubiquinone/menaquinone biosynthesis C-methylase UbiE|nr:class I SAM-dependent methyltransferase [Methylococcaceae bacterium]